MSKSVSRNYIYNLSYQIICLLTPLITTPYVSRVLGPNGIGIYSYTTSIVAYFIILGSMGLADYGQREIAYHQNNRHEQSRIFYEISLFRILTVFSSLILYYFVVLRSVETNYEIFIIQSLNILALLFDVSWFFQGLEDFGKVVFRNLIVRILSIILLFILVNTYNDLWIYILINSSLSLLGGICVCLYLPKYLEKVKWDEIKIFRNWKVIFELFLPQVAIQVYTVLDKTMIGLFSTVPAENGYYEQAEKCMKLALMIVTSLGAVMLPRIANAYANGDEKTIYNNIMISFRFVWFLSLPMVVIIIAVAPNFIPWFMGDGFDKVILLLQFLSLLLIAIGFSNIIGIQFLVATNKQNLMTISVCCGAVVNFILNLILIPQIQSMGAVIASIFAEFLVTLIQFYMVRTSFNIKRVCVLSKNYFYGAILSLIMMYALSLIVPINIFGSFAIVLLGMSVYISILLINHDELIYYAVKKIAKKLNIIIR